MLLFDRQSMKQQGRLDISQTMPVQNLIQDLLRNGIDLSFLNPDDSILRSHHSFVIGKKETSNKKHSEEKKRENGDGMEVPVFDMK